MSTNVGVGVLDGRGRKPSRLALAAAGAGGLVMFLFVRAMSRPCTCCMERYLIKLDDGAWVCPQCDLSADFVPVRTLQKFDVYFFGQKPGVWRGKAGA